MVPNIETRQVDGATFLLAPERTVGTYVEQLSVVESPVFNPTRFGKGKLIPIGGNASEDNFKVLSGEVVKGSGVTIVSFPTLLPDKRYEDIAEPLKKHGVEGPIFHLRENLLPDIGAMMMDRSSLIKITGGDQIRGRDIFNKSELDKKLIERRNMGVSIAGTSAGSNIMSEVMPYGNRIVRGIGLTDISYDTHFRQLDRYGRQVDLVETEGVISVGFDEGTGVVDDDGEVTAFGEGEAVIRYHNGRLEDPIVLRGGDRISLNAIRQYIKMAA